MALDERRFDELIVESQDLQSEAMSTAREVVPDMRDLANDRRHDEVDPDQQAQFGLGRRRLLRNFGLAGLTAGVFGPLISSIVAGPAAAQAGGSIDVQILQTASSLERLAINTYGVALALPFIKSGNQVIVKFAQTTMMQHDQHRQAFQAQTTALGGKVQDTPNAKNSQVVAQALPTLKAPADVVKLAMTLEQVARDTYLSDMSMFTDKKSRTLMATVMGVETQHLATLRAVAALLAGNGAALIAIPVDPAKLPAAAGSAGFPEAIPTPSKASPPAEGAVQ